MKSTPGNAVGRPSRGRDRAPDRTRATAEDIIAAVSSVDASGVTEDARAAAAAQLRAADLGGPTFFDDRVPQPGRVVPDVTALP
jgi:hypothetical protein